MTEEKDCSAGLDGVLAIFPYKQGGSWMFDDAPKGLVREPLIRGADMALDECLETNPNLKEDGGIKLLFSDAPFKGYRFQLNLLRGDQSGNFYYCPEFGYEVWLCPALYKYFATAPANIFMAAEAKEGLKLDYATNLRNIFGSRIRRGSVDNAEFEDVCSASNMLGRNEQCVLRVDTGQSHYHLTDRRILHENGAIREVMRYRNIGNWHWISENPQHGDKTRYYDRFELVDKLGRKEVLEWLGTSWLPFHRFLRTLDLTDVKGV